jgi:hypothetical protein
LQRERERERGRESERKIITGKECTELSRFSFFFLQALQQHCHAHKGRLRRVNKE